MPIKDKEKIIQDLIKKTEGYTGADIESLAREAAMLALRENMDAQDVKKKHFDEALKKVKPSVSDRTIKVYKQVEDQFLKSAKAAVPNENTYLG